MEAKKKPAKNDKTERNINDFAVGDRVKVVRSHSPRVNRRHSICTIQLLAMLARANAFEISDIQEDESEAVLAR